MDLVRDIDPNLILEDEVEELILSYVDVFVDRVLNGARKIASHRQEKTIEVKDVQQFLSECFRWISSLLAVIICLAFFRSEFRYVGTWNGHRRAQGVQEEHDQRDSQAEADLDKKSSEEILMLDLCFGVLDMLFLFRRVLF